MKIKQPVAVQSGVTRTPLPDDVYIAKIAEASAVPDQWGGSLKMRMEVTTGPFAGRWIWARVFSSGPLTGAFEKALGLSGEVNPEQLIGRVLKVYLVQKVRKDGQGTWQVAGDFKAVDA